MSIPAEDAAFLAQFSAPKKPSGGGTGQFHTIARQAAQRHGFDPEVFVRQIRQESGFNPKARSPVGAMGIAQIMPDTAKSWGVNPDDPVASLEAAAKNMASYYRTYRNQGHDDATAKSYALAAYNAGPGAVAKHRGIPPYRETQNYVRTIMGGTVPRSGGVRPASASPAIPQEDADFLAQFSGGSLPQVTTPSIYANDGDALPDILVNGPPDFTPQIQAIQDLKTPTLHSPSLPDRTGQQQAVNSIGDLAIAGLNRPRPVAAQTPGIVEGLGNVANSVGSGLQAGAQSVIDAVRYPGDLLDAAGKAVQSEAQATQSPLDIAGGVVGGMAQGAAGVANSVMALPADLGNAYMGRKEFSPAAQIPTGDLDKYLEDKPASAFVGNMLLPLGPGGAAVKAGKGIAAKIAAGAGTGAGFGFFSQPGELAQRTKSGVEIGALGVGLAGAGVGFGAAARRMFPEKITADMTPEQITEALTPEEQALIDRHIQANPEHATADAPALRSDFKARGGEIPGSPRGNVDAEILGPDGKPANVQTDRLKSSYEIAMEKLKGKDLASDTPKIEIARTLPEGREVDTTYQPDKINPAQESASVISRYADDIDTAKQLRDEALSTLQAKEQELIRSAKTADVVEAQRAFGSRINELEQKADVTRLTDGERQELSYRRGLYDSVLEARKALLDSEALYKEASEVTPRSSLPESPLNPRMDLARPKGDLPNTRDMAMARAESISKLPDLATPPKAVKPGKPPKLTGERLIKTPADLARTPSTGLIKTVGDLARTPSKTVELFPKATPEKLDIVGPSGKPVDTTNFMRREPQGVESSIDVPDTLLSPDTAPESVKAEVAAKGGQLISIADAERHVKQFGTPEQMKHLLNVIESAKQQQSVSLGHKPLDAGGKIENVRETSVVAIEKRPIKGRTEVSNLRREFSPAGDGVNADLGAIRDNLVQRLNKNGIQVSSKEQVVTGNQRTAIKRLNALADKLPEPERTHVYIYDHNFDLTERGQSHGARRLDRITESSLTGKKADIPSGSDYQNQIAPAFQVLDQIMASEQAPPELKRIVKQMASGTVSKQSMGELVKILQKTPDDIVQMLCRL